MGAPLITVSRFKVKKGKNEDFREYYKKILDIVETNEPQIIAFHGFLNEDGSEMTSIQVHPNSASMEFHLQVLKDNWDETFNKYSDMVEGIETTYYGLASEGALAMSRDTVDEDSIYQFPVHIDGFTRTNAEVQDQE